MKLKQISAIFLLIAIAFSCAKQDCLKSAGSTTKEFRALKGFDKIQIYNYFNVYLKSDTVNKIEIEAGENIIQNIETNIVDSVLIIKDLNACGFMKGYKEKNIYISAKKYTSLIIEDGVNLFSVDTLRFDKMLIRYLSDIGASDITAKCRMLHFEVWYGAGNFTLKGKADYLTLGMNSMSNTFAEDLEANYSTVRNNSLGNIYVNAKKRLNVSILSEGNVYYKGKPEIINLNDSVGTGKLINIGD